MGMVVGDLWHSVPDVLDLVLHMYMHSHLRKEVAMLCLLYLSHNDAGVHSSTTRA